MTNELSNIQKPYIVIKYMKSILAITLLVVLGEACYSQGTLVVTVSNIKKFEGDVRVGLFNNENDFLKKAVDGKVTRATDGSVVVTFEGLPDGEYAISVFHDENANEKLDTNFVGIPKEGFAFGNNAMGMFGPPSFEKSKVVIKRGATAEQSISLKYF